MWDLSRLGICRLWRDRFKDLFPTLFLMSLGSSPSFFLHPNIEETVANEPFSLSCAWCSQKSLCRRKAGRCWRPSLLFHVADSLQLGRWALCQEVPGNSEKKKVVVICWGRKGLLRAKWKGKSSWALRVAGPPEKNMLKLERKVASKSFQSLGEPLRSPLCGQWKSIGLWFLGIANTRGKVFKISAFVWESTGIRER